MEWLQNRLLYIELVVVTVVGGGEDVEKSESVWFHAGQGFSTGLLMRRGRSVESCGRRFLSTSDVDCGC